MSGPSWTIDELAQRVADALASGGVRAPNGRVTPLPDRRLIRWYATIGLLDRPARGQGRSARYGERHLLQLVAVKQRQAEGRSLAEVQAELAGATDATLRRVTGIPEPDGNRTAAGTSPAAVRSRPERFWREPIAAPATEPATVPAPATEPATVPAAAPEPATPVYLVRLHQTASLALRTEPDPDDLAAIHAASRPLLDLLAARGLLADSAVVAAGPRQRPPRSP